MEKIEIESILRAAAEKTQFMRSEFDAALEAWAGIDWPEDTPGEQKLVLFESTNWRGDSVRYFLKRGSSMLDYEICRGNGEGGTEWVEASQYPDLTEELIMTTIDFMADKLAAFFRGIQREIDVHSEYGRRIAAIAAKMK